MCAELDGMRIAVSVMGKQKKAFKKLYEVKPDLEVEDEDADVDEGKNWYIIMSQSTSKFNTTSFGIA